MNEQKRVAKHIKKKTEMRSKRPIIVNLSLCHGICNYACPLCGINKDTYKGLRQNMPIEMVETLIDRVKSAGKDGVYVRKIDISGAGEPTLHPEFGNVMSLLNQMRDNWDAPVVAPEFHLITNGSMLDEQPIIEAIKDITIQIRISFPTSNPENYGKLMFGDASRGPDAISKAISGINAIAEITKEKGEKKLYFNISPPDRKVIRADFEGNVRFLTKIVAKWDIPEIEMVIFPSTTNRSGFVKNPFRGIDDYKDLFRRWDKETVNGVKVNLTSDLKIFFPEFWQILDIIRSYDYPCIWSSSLFVAGDGNVICCNDQAIKNPIGNILEHSIEQIMINRERYTPISVCRSCDVAPQKLYGSPLAVLYSTLARIRMAWARMKRRE